MTSLLISANFCHLSGVLFFPSYKSKSLDQRTSTSDLLLGGLQLTLDRVANLLGLCFPICISIHWAGWAGQPLRSPSPHQQSSLQVGQGPRLDSGGRPVSCCTWGLGSSRAHIPLIRAL